jgi:DNA-binding NtrC family response regulator
VDAAPRLLPFREAMREFRRGYFIRMLEFTNGSVNQARLLARMNRSHFYKWLHKLSIQPNDYRPKGSPAANRAHRGNWGD